MKPLTLLSPVGIIACCLAAIPLASANERPLPTGTEVKEQLASRMEQSQAEKESFEQGYTYVRKRIREERNTKGKLRKRTEDVYNHIPQGRENANSESSPRYGEKDVSLDASLLERFTFDVETREELEGRVVLRVAFRPASDDLPSKSSVDRFINRTEGTLWLEEDTMALLKAHMRLLEPVEFLAGIAGVVYSLDMKFERACTPEGDWYTRQGHWLADYRAFLVRKVVEFEETRGDVEKHVTAPDNAG